METRPLFVKASPSAFDLRRALAEAVGVSQSSFASSIGLVFLRLADADAELWRTVTTDVSWQYGKYGKYIEY
jgi:pyrroloquinoline quinone (PQQ) biosynthesis protein C